MTSVKHSFTVAMLGTAGCGKTTYLHRHATGHFLDKYEETKEKKETKLLFYTSEGVVLLNCVENQIEGKKDAALVMFDRFDSASFEHAALTASIMMEQKLPVVLCGNKIDIKPTNTKKRVRHNDIAEFIHEEGITYYDISAKSNYNFEKPFLYLLRRLIKSDLQLVAQSECP